MSETKHTVTINGRLYDALSGMPLPQPIAPAKTVRPSQPKTHAPQPGAHHVHQTPQKSQTLVRSALKRPQTAMQPDVTIPPSGPQRSQAIVRFAPAKPASQYQQSKAIASDPPIQPPRTHPLVQRLLDNQSGVVAQSQQTQTSRQHKEDLIRQNLAAAQPNTEPAAPSQPSSWFARQPRVASVLMASLAMLVLGGYITYLNLPNISMRVAATRAGVAAHFPEYKPQGYQLSGPISYGPGEVTIGFRTSDGTSTYNIKQKKSNWDSQALLQNYVLPQSRVYLTYQEHGLTVYSFGNSAAWVNGGILYIVDGNATLSSEQLLNIATNI